MTHIRLETNREISRKKQNTRTWNIWNKSSSGVPPLPQLSNTLFKTLLLKRNHTQLIHQLIDWCLFAVSEINPIEHWFWDQLAPGEPWPSHVGSPNFRDNVTDWSHPHRMCFPDHVHTPVPGEVEGLLAAQALRQLIELRNPRPVLGNHHPSQVPGAFCLYVLCFVTCCCC